MRGRRQIKIAQLGLQSGLLIQYQCNHGKHQVRETPSHGTACACVCSRQCTRRGYRLERRPYSLDTLIGAKPEQGIDDSLLYPSRACNRAMKHAFTLDMAVRWKGRVVDVWETPVTARWYHCGVRIQAERTKGSSCQWCLDRNFCLCIKSTEDIRKQVNRGYHAAIITLRMLAIERKGL